MTFHQPKRQATYDFYGPVHKGLRLSHANMLVRLGNADIDDALAMAELMADLRTELLHAEHHLANEDAAVHTALEARSPGAAESLMQAHTEHRRTFLELEVLILTIEAADALDRARLMRQLYLRFSEFVAEDFAHMAEEEQEVLPLLQRLFTDEELMAIEHQILSAMAPEELVAFGRMMVPAARPADRITLVSHIRDGAPAEAFAEILDATCAATLSERDFARLCEGLGLAA